MYQLSVKTAMKDLYSQKRSVMERIDKLTIRAVAEVMAASFADDPMHMLSLIIIAGSSSLSAGTLSQAGTINNMSKIESLANVSMISQNRDFDFRKQVIGYSINSQVSYPLYYYTGRIR